MSYEGDSIAEMIADAKRELEPMLRDIVHDTVDHWRDVTRRNTPIESFIKPVATKPPYHLRNSWELSTLRVFEDPAGETGFEADVYTEVEYAPYVEEGTGLWGPQHRKYVIRPKRPGGWLSWIARDTYTRRDGSIVNAGQRVFAKEVLHPGSPGSFMLSIGQHMTEAEFESIAERRIAEWVRRVEAAS